LGGSTADAASSVAEFSLPDTGRAALRDQPFLRVSDFLPYDVAMELHRELRDGIQYERVVLGDVTRQARAARPLGGVYLEAMLRHPGWCSSNSAMSALDWFDSEQFISWLSVLAGEALKFLRPVTAYRMTTGDRLCLHDDMSAPEHAVSVAYNLTLDWQAAWGGATRFGDVTGTTELPTPADSPIDLREWHIANERRFYPQFNSLVVMKLGTQFAHGVEEIVGDGSRYAVVGIYGRDNAVSHS
jgi:hypothetical protein